jgi:hypothetical protein
MSVAATNREQLLAFLCITAINCGRFAFVISRADRNFHFAVAVEIVHGKEFVGVRRIKTIFLSDVGFWVKLPLRYYSWSDFLTVSTEALWLESNARVTI